MCVLLYPSFSCSQLVMLCVQCIGQAFKTNVKHVLRIVVVACSVWTLYAIYLSFSFCVFVPDFLPVSDFNIDFATVQHFGMHTEVTKFTKPKQIPRFFTATSNKNEKCTFCIIANVRLRISRYSNQKII